MKKKKWSRREVLFRSAKLMMIASGLNGAKVEPLFAQTHKVTTTAQKLNFEQIANIKAQNLNAKILKGLLFPRRDIFINEFGRTPGEIGRLASGATGCEFFFSTASHCGSQDCGNMSVCNENACDNQRCGQFSNCPSNNCGKQTSQTSLSCSVNNQNIFSGQFLDRIKADPFIQALMKELNVKTSQELSHEFQRMLIQRRQTIPAK